MSGTPAASLAWRIAAAETAEAGHAEIPPALLLTGILSLVKLRPAQVADLELSADDGASVLQEAATLAEIVGGYAAGPTELRRAARNAAGKADGAAARPHPGIARRPISRSAATKAVFARAAELAAANPFSALHLLAALAEAPDATIAAACESCRIAPPDLATRVRAVLGPAAAGDGAPRGPESASPRPAGAPRDRRTPTLDTFGRDLTALARRGELRPVIGRRAELLALVQTLARSTKPNPLLVGEPGVGKTALVEGLAVRAAEGRDGILAGRRIVELNLGALVGGTGYRGELEERLTRILEEARACPELVVFVDEVHTLVGAGRVGGGGQDAASLVKPALARGELRLIGATTPAEYRNSVEKDPALARRFEVIEIAEPDAAEALEILRGLRPRFEAHHGVKIEDGALEAAVSLSQRFLPERRLPDKAIDVVDRAAARACVPQLSLRADGPLLKNAPVLDVAVGQPRLSARAGDGSNGGDAPAMGGVVDAALVAATLAEKLKLPLELVQAAGAGAGSRAATLAAFLKTRLFGQDAVVDSVARRLRLAHSGLQQRRGPLAALLLLGPTGVGKTELARLLAEHFFGSASDLVRFDMSEYIEEHAVARLLGAPPGYVGHEEEGQLTRALRSKPYCVVLLDEVEKAHPRVFDVFLQVFDNGRVTDARGRSADARQAIFVLTSNLGSSRPRERVGFGARDDEAIRQAAEAAIAEARQFFRTEFLNRLDELLVFRPLDEPAARRILRLRLERFVTAADERRGVHVTIEPEAEAFVLRAGTSPESGARELARTVERLVEAPFSNLLVSGKACAGSAWRLVYDEGGVYWLAGSADA